MSDFKPVVFRLGQEEYGVDITIVHGIENVLPVIPLSNVSPFIKGIINLRGDIVPVYSLRRKFNMPDAVYTDESKFILVKAGEIMLALEADAIGEIQNIEENNMYQIPKIIKTDKTTYYERIISIDKRIIVMIDVMELLDDMERETLSEAINDL